MTSISTRLPIYLDYHATTPVDPRVAAIVLRVMTSDFGNANSAELSARFHDQSASTPTTEFPNCQRYPANGPIV